MTRYRSTLTHDLEDMDRNGVRAHERLQVLESREEALHTEMDERKEKMRALGEDLSKWKEEHADKVEQRK